MGLIIPSRTAKEFTDRVIAHYRKSLEKLKQLNLPTPPIEEGEFKIKNFNNGEFDVQLLSSVREKTVHLFAQFRQGTEANNEDGFNLHEDIFEVLILLDTLKRAGLNRVFAYFPFLPYLRQDKKDKGREPISARLIFDLITVAAGGGTILSRIATADMHSKTCQGLSNLPIDEISPLPLFGLYYKTKFQEEIKKGKVIVVSPDIGGSRRAHSLAEQLGTELATIYKKREKGKGVESLGIMGDVRGKIPIMIDDMIDTGNTIIQGAELLRMHGVDEEERIYACATHGLFSFDREKWEPAERKFYNANIEVLITNTIPRPKEYYDSCYKWLKVIDMSKYFADVVYCNESATSLSDTLTRHQQRAKELKSNLDDYLIPVEAGALHWKALRKKNLALNKS